MRLLSLLGAVSSRERYTSGCPHSKSSVLDLLGRSRPDTWSVNRVDQLDPSSDSAMKTGDTSVVRATSADVPH